MIKVFRVAGGKLSVTDLKLDTTQGTLGVGSIQFDADDIAFMRGAITFEKPSVTFSLKDSFSIFEEMKVPVESIRVGGGGARSPLWRQIQAEVFGRMVETVEAEEGRLNLH